MKITREMISAAHDITMRHKIVLGHELLGEIYQAMKSASPAQPQQGPVAYAVYHRMGGSKSLHWPEQHSPDGDANEYQLLPLYTFPPMLSLAQRQRSVKPLTDEELLHFVDIHVGAPSMAYPLDNSDWITFARAIEAAHQIGVEK